MGRKSQHKGRAGELELSRILRGYGYQVEPGQAVSYGATPDITGLPGIHIECKRCEQVRLSEWMAQAERDSKRFRDGLPAVFHRRSREGWRVTMNLVDFMRLYDRQKVPETAEGKKMTNDTQKRKSLASPACVPYKGRSGTGGGDR